LEAALGSASWPEDRALLLEDQHRRLRQLSKEQSSDLIALRLRRLVERLRRGPRSAESTLQPEL
jgi:hypothetical protein